VKLTQQSWAAGRWNWHDGKNGRMPKILYVMMDLAPSVMLQFTSICDDVAVWAAFVSLLRKTADDDGLCPSPEHENTSHWIGLAVLSLLEMAADFWRRVINCHETWPMKIFWLIASSPAEPDQLRTAIARELIVIDFSTMSLKQGQFARKITKQFYNDLSLAALEGTLSERLHDLLVQIAWQLFQDTAEIEGMNSILKIMIKKSPNIHLELLSSRLTIKKALASRLANNHKVETDALLQLAVQHHSDAKLE
jgi:hypothetical protein